MKKTIILIIFFLSVHVFRVHAMRCTIANKARTSLVPVLGTLAAKYKIYRGSGLTSRDAFCQRNNLRQQVYILERQGLDESDAQAQQLRNQINELNAMMGHIANKHVRVAGGLAATAFVAPSVRLMVPMLLQSLGGVFIKGVLSAYGKDKLLEELKKRHIRFFACSSEKKSSLWLNCFSAGLITALMTYLFEQHKEYEAQQKTLKGFEDLMSLLGGIESKFIAVDHVSVGDSILKQHYKQELLADFQNHYAQWIATLPADILKVVMLEELAHRRRKIDQTYQESINKSIDAQNLVRPLTQEDAKKTNHLDDLYEASLGALRIPEQTHLKSWHMLFAKPSQYSQHSPAQLVNLVKDVENKLKNP